MTTTTEPLYLDDEMPEDWVLEHSSAANPFGHGFVPSAGYGFPTHRLAADGWLGKSSWTWTIRIRNPLTNDTRPVVFENRPAPAKAETCKAERKLAAGWVRAATVGVKVFDGRKMPWLCAWGSAQRPHGSGVPAAYYQNNFGHVGACEACAESAGVFADRAAGRAGAVQFGIDPGADEGTAVIAVEYGPDGEPRIVGQEIVWHNKPVDPRAARRAEWLRNWTSQSDAGLESSVAVESGIVGGSRIERANAHLRPRWPVNRSATVAIQGVSEPSFCEARDK